MKQQEQKRPRKREESTEANQVPLFVDLSVKLYKEL